MEYQSLFSGKNKTHIISLSSAELAQRAVKMNTVAYILLIVRTIHKYQLLYCSDLISRNFVSK